MAIMLSQPSPVLDTEARHLLFVKIFIKKKILATQLKDTKIMCVDQIEPLWP